MQGRWRFLECRSFHQSNLSIYFLVRLFKSSPKVGTTIWLGTGDYGWEGVVRLAPKALRVPKTNEYIFGPFPHNRRLIVVITCYL